MLSLVSSIRIRPGTTLYIGVPFQEEDCCCRPAPECDVRPVDQYGSEQPYYWTEPDERTGDERWLEVLDIPQMESPER
jgi:hypothetical protein